MTILLLMSFMFNNFVQKWYLPQGVNGFGSTPVQIIDTDRDGNIELIFTTYGTFPRCIYFYELHLPNTWEVDSTSTPGGDLLWNSGDLDLDGLYDLLLQFHIENPTLADGIMIYESPDSFSYPTQEVWRDTVGPPLVLPICVYDIDMDGIPEIVKNIATPYGHLGIYESIGDNQYSLIFVDDPDTTGNDAPAATIAFGDFDNDGMIEFVPAGADDWYWIYECTGNNSYEKIAEGQLPTNNIRDGLSVNDADADNKMEFVLKGNRISSSLIDAFIFEAIANNTYDTVKTFTFPGGDYSGGYSAAGDVDGDSIPEIVLEARQNVFIIKAEGNDSFYVWDTLPGNASGSSVAIYDLDINGLNEIIISGNNQTWIYEYNENGITVESKYGIKETRLQVQPNPFRSTTKIKCNVPQDSSMKLQIFNATGRLVKEFTHHVDNQVFWNGTDNQGRKLPGGIFFLRYKEAYYTEVIKLILIR